MATNVAVVPAQPGYFALRWCDGDLVHVPVIAWLIDLDGRARPACVEYDAGNMGCYRGVYHESNTNVVHTFVEDDCAWPFSIGQVEDFAQDEKRLDRVP